MVFAYFVYDRTKPKVDVINILKSELVPFISKGYDDVTVALITEAYENAKHLMITDSGVRKKVTSIAKDESPSVSAQLLFSCALANTITMNANHMRIDPSVVDKFIAIGQALKFYAERTGTSEADIATMMNQISLSFPFELKQREAIRREMSR